MYVIILYIVASELNVQSVHAGYSIFSLFFWWLGKKVSAVVPKK